VEQRAGFAMYFRRNNATLPAMPAGLLALGEGTSAVYDVTLYHGFEPDGPAVTHTAAELRGLSIGLGRGESLLLKYSAKSKSE